MFKKKTKINGFLFTILMVILFLIISEGIIWGIAGKSLVKIIFNYAKGRFVVSEAVLASLVLIVMLLFKNGYVFTEKKEKLSVGLFYGLFYILGSIFFFLIMLVGNKGYMAGYSLINLAIGCFLVGICEEFLCRGWLLNEFLERFGDTKKGVWYSIIISGIIFGLMHLGNILSGQAVIITIGQVINAAGIGIVLGTIYYKTKNIWSVILLHAMWDFSLMISQVSPVYVSYEVTLKYSVFSLIIISLMVVCELLSIIPHIKLDKNTDKKSVMLYSIIGFVMYFVLMIIQGFISQTIGTQYRYDSIKLDNYYVIRDNYDKYNIEYNNKSYSLYEDDGNLIFKNNNTNYYGIIKCSSLRDYIIYEINNCYVLAYIDYENSINNYIKFVYIDKNSLNNSNSFIDNTVNNISKYLISDMDELVVVGNDNNTYVSAYDMDYGYYLLSGDSVYILNRD